VRTYAPAATEVVLERLLEEPSLARAVTHHAHLPPREAVTAPFPTWLDRRIVQGLEERGITSLYSHQAEAVEAVHAGEDIVVVTPTASGKTLCYALPVLQALAEDPSARALFLFPTKALGQDQVAEFAGLAKASSLDVAAATYDGDTPAPIRSAIRTAGQVVVTNPDMLHSAILPHHTKWFQLFEQVQVIVIDELHTYRGVFGSHVANVIRRLLRLCAHYGSNPIIVCSSATIGNPAELAAQLTGRVPRLIDRNGAPAGARHVLLVDPPLLDPATGARGSALTHAERWALPFIRAGRQTIVFGRARVAVEIILTRLREALREHLGPRSRIRGYRGGYLPTERRAIERGLRDGEILGVVSTNALELGVDIGALDVAVLAGYPGSVAGTWQQLGRAGRRQEVSVGVLIASGSPVDQYVIHHPEFLLEGTPEEARIDPDNLHVLLAHLRCATFERPFEPAEVFGPGPVDDLLAFIGEEGHVRQSSDGRWYWSSENFPASEVSLRTAAPENVVIIDTTPDRPRVIGETDLFSAQVLVHTQAIYLHESQQYHVDKLDWGERKAYVRKVDVDYYTYANRAVTLKPLDVFATDDAPGGSRVHGEVMVASLVTLFKKLKFGTDENVGWGPIDLPELELQTTAYWLTCEDVIRPGRGVAGLAEPADLSSLTLAVSAPSRLALGTADVLSSRHSAWRKDDLDVALLGAGRGIQAVAAVLLMCDPRDLGLVTQVRSPHSEAPTIYLYEAVPGGVGLAERLWKRHDELVAGARAMIEACGCDAGCPACTGPRLDPEVNGKALALRLLAQLTATGRRAAAPAAEAVPA
jgi:DEAD/DEAH box helicase domain-containing protein